MKRIFSVLLSLLLSFSMVGCTLLIPLDGLRPAPHGNPEDSYPYEPDDRSYGYFYDQLSEDSRAVYRAILQNRDKTDGVVIILPKTLMLSFTQEEEAKMTEAITETVLSITQPAIDALLYDNPEFFYVCMGGENSSTFSITHRKEQKAEGGATVYMRKLTFILRTENLSEGKSLSEDITALEEAVTAFRPSAESRAEQLLEIANYLAAHVTYDSGAARPHCAAGALLDGRAVCDGYAKAFSLLCKQAGIPSVIVAGRATQKGKSEPHAWNYVQLEDGLWYAVDVTWDDAGRYAKNNYFLIGADNAEFAESHTPVGRFSEGEHPEFVYPTLAPTSYVLA